MEILGIVGSARKMGNTEILVKEALRVARDEGAEVSLVRLSDLRIMECNGCMACALRGDPCRLRDDMDWLLGRLRSAQGLVVGAPSYDGMPPGIFKTISDRYIVRGSRDLAEGKWAVSIGVAGGTHIAWWLIPQLNRFARAFGFDLLGSFIAGSQGPGEVLLSERKAIIDEVDRLSRDLLFALRGQEECFSDGVHRLRGWNWAAHGWGEEKLFTVEHCCPYCFSEAFTTLHGARPEQDPMEVECAFCHNSTGRLVEEDGILVPRLTSKSKENVQSYHQEHHSGWVRGSGTLFSARRHEIVQARAVYKDLIPWLRPPQHTETAGGPSSA